MGERYGYVRVSTKDQHPDRQIENIKKHYPDIKDDNLFIEKISGKKGMDERDEYAVLRRIVRSGDELVIDAILAHLRRKNDGMAPFFGLRDAWRGCAGEGYSV